MNNDTAVDISVTSHTDSISEMSCAVIHFVYEACVCVCVEVGLCMHACKHSYNFKYEIVLPVCVSVFPRCVTVRLHLFTHARRLVFLPSNINAILRTSQSVHCVVCVSVCVCV